MFRIILLFFLSLPLSILAQVRGAELPMGDSPEKPFSGKTYAVIVGIDSYQSPNIPHLYYAVSDARAFEDFLQSNAGGKVPKENIRMFINDSATTGRFKKLGLSWVKNIAKKGDRVYLYFSGHGLTVSGGDSYFLANNLSNDFDIVNIEEAGTQAMYQLKTNTIRPLHDSGVQVMLIMDACRSHLEKTMRSSMVTAFSPNMKSAEMKAGDYMFLSSSNGQVSAETPQDNMKHGVFTYFLLSGLYGMADNGRNADGKITFNKLKNYVTQQVSDYSNERQIPIIEKSDEENPTLAIVDSFLLARQLKLEQGSFSGSMAVNMNKFGNGKSVNTLQMTSMDTSETYAQFMGAIQTGKIWGDEGSVHYFDELEKKEVSIELLKDAVLSLSALLIDSGQNIINAYISSNLETFSKLGAKNTMNSLDTIFLRGAMIFDILYRYYSKYYPDDPDNKLYLQNFYFMMGRSLIHDEESQKNSLEYLQSAYDLNPKSLYILHAIDIILSDDPVRKQEVLVNEKKVVAKYSNWPFALNLLAYVYESTGQLDSSLKYRRLAQSASPYDMWNLGNLSRLCILTHHFGEAKKYFDIVVTIIKNNRINDLYKIGDENTFLAKLFLDVNDLDSVKFYIRKFVSNENNKNYDWSDWYNIGKIFYNDFKNYDTALYCFKRAIELKPETRLTNIFLLMASCYDKLNQPEKARTTYTDALSLTTNDHEKDETWNELGGYYLNRGMPDSALNCFAKMKLDTLQQLILMGRYYKSINKSDSLMVNFDRAINMLRTHYLKLDNINYSWVAEVWTNMCFTQGISPKWASDKLNQLYQYFKDNNIRDADAWAVIARSLEKAGEKKTDSAYAQLDDILLSNKYFDKSDAEDWYYSPACFYFNRNLSHNRTIRFLEKAVSLDPNVGDHKAMERLNILKKSQAKEKRK